MLCALPYKRGDEELKETLTTLPQDKMDEDAFEKKYIEAEGALPLLALKILLEDYAQLKSKTQMFADAQNIAETLRDFGLDAWESFEDLTVEDATEAGMRRLDARGFVKAIAGVRAKRSEADGGAGDDCAESGVTSEDDASSGADASEAANIMSGGSQDVLQAQDLESIVEEADDEVQVGPVSAGDGFTGINNVSGYTEATGGLTTDSEQQDEVPGGMQSQNFEAGGASKAEIGGSNPNPRVAADQKRDRSQSRDSSVANSEHISMAVSEGLSRGLQQVGEHLSRAIGFVEKSTRRSAVKGAALPILKASATGKLSVHAVTEWLRALQQKRSTVAGLSVYIDTLVDDPRAFEEDAKVVNVLDTDDDCHLYHDVRGSIDCKRVFKKYGKAEGMLASLLLRNVYLAAIKKTPQDLAMLVVEFYHNIQPVQNAEYLHYLFLDWKSLLMEIRFADNLSTEMVHQSAQVLLQRFQPALARADRYLKEQNDFGIETLIEGLELGVELAVEGVVEHKRLVPDGSTMGEGIKALKAAADKAAAKGKGTVKGGVCV